MKLNRTPCYLSLCLCLPLLFACQQGEVNYYSDDTPIRLDLKAKSLTILQFTDLHLTFGIDHNDQKTFTLIDKMVQYTNPDLIVFSGDQTMAPFGVSLFQMLGRRVEKHQIPWTFVFGNHDNDHDPYEAYLKILGDFEYLQFKVGPEIDEGGYGNFSINTYYGDAPFYNVYLLDSHTEAPGDLHYGWVSEAQVQWYQNKVATDTVKHTVFMHIPLIEFNDSIDLPLNDGERGEDMWPQGKNTGFFQAMVDSHLAQAFFAGHDHDNSFCFTHPTGIILGYGVASGFNGYGSAPKGARTIHINSLGVFSTKVIYAAEVGL
ncbi:MAG: metallophosphoesterase [Bacilli bacterium]|jgi:3',5'-cyclic AMP phosphodiesterase CpdA